MRSTRLPSAALLWIALVQPAASAERHAAGDLVVRATANTDRLVPYQIFELTFRHEGRYRDPTWALTIDAALRSPAGRSVRAGGFFYGADLWKARYAPAEIGRWTYTYTVRDPAGRRAGGGGSFHVVRGRVRSKGWLRVNPRNRLRLIFEDGSPYWPIGLQKCIGDGNHNGSVLDAIPLEGPFRPDPEGRRPKPPPGPLFARGPSMNPQNADVYFRRHARAGFDLWRFSPHNCSIPVFEIPRDPGRAGPAKVDAEQARMVDELLRTSRKYGLRNLYGIFGFARAFNDAPGDARGMAEVKRIIKYSVDRWGAYVDIWEILNEQKAETAWYEQVIPYLRSIDPYGKPIATSWERPELAGIDIDAPHWYGREPELASDRVTADRARRRKRFGKPVIYGEQGNGGGRLELEARGIGGVWDPGSARRMRVRLWTAFFEEIALVFWETSYAKDGHRQNIWIGPEERQYVRALQDFAYRLDTGIAPVSVDLAGPGAGEVRAYGLRSDRRAAVYLHHAACAACARARREGRSAEHGWDHDRGRVEGLRIAIDVPRDGTAYWYRPRDAAILGRAEARAGRRTLAAPPFAVDLALLVSEAGPPDIDRDGKPNDDDPDDDGDGVPDGKDAFPLEAEEWADADHDRIGDRLDADIDGDGKPDDRDGNGIPDSEDLDRDGDGVPRANAIPWDAFPLDPRVRRDTDGDGIGDNLDPDDDGDGFTDEEERRAGTDPLDPVRFPEGSAAILRGEGGTL